MKNSLLAKNASQLNLAVVIVSMICLALFNNLPASADSSLIDGRVTLQHPGALPHYNFSRARALDSLTTYSSDTASYQAASQSLDMAARSPSLPLFSFPLPGYPPVFYATVGQPPGTAAPL